MVNLSILDTPHIFDKLKNLASECDNLLTGLPTRKFTTRPAREIAVLPNRMLPTRLGLQTSAGQAKLLHDLANIELQAMELGLRTLYEFPDTPCEFRHQLVDIIIEESRHLRLCLEGIEQLGYQWGSWPVHTNLWDATDCEDSLLDRILIVHCYLEASGLDSGELILNRLSGVTNKGPRDIVSVIAHDEISHVQYGLKWYRGFCSNQGLNSQDDFELRLASLRHRIPKRAAKINAAVRRRAGFNDRELEILRKFSESTDSP